MVHIIAVLKHTFFQVHQLTSVAVNQLQWLNKNFFSRQFSALLCARLVIRIPSRKPTYYYVSLVSSCLLVRKLRPSMHISMCLQIDCLLSSSLLRNYCKQAVYWKVSWYYTEQHSVVVELTLDIG